MKKTINMMGKLLFWSAMLIVGLMAGIPAVIYQAWSGDSIDAAANAMSGLED